MNRTVFSTGEQAGPAFIETLVCTWWPLAALALGILLILAGGILFSS